MVRNKILGSEIQIQPKTEFTVIRVVGFCSPYRKNMFGVAVQPLHTLPLPNTETVDKVQRLCK
ncbi:hypothetical protein QUB80_01245 [Chlorogloeopsis sp. ULAP01]|uniref:hypothetical protein n=1 Tax=Chlorogloeopsis sp. ULAP01 TaxID=3056483 RepID=UPI0025AAA64F|nr:hypothetical protein [Chlorogloeopsis sp. ULAP01]MDM9379334.1 hypothetical protein [Chlorogloeopsis sp. ULAP01]